MKKCIIYITLNLMVLSALCQDSHFSLFNFRFGSLNPALTGFNQPEGEVRSMYRTQWNNIVPITYMNLEAEKQDELWGYGLAWNKHGAGVGSIISNQINLGASRQVDLSSNSLLRLGMQLGYFQHSLDWNGTIFENQYNSNGTVGTDNGEDLTLNKSSSLDMNAGLFYSKKSDRNTITAGIALGHIAHNKLSLFIDGSEALQSKKTFHFSLEIPRENDWSIKPSLLFQNQGTASESILSVMAKKDLEERKNISFGAGIRFRDAIIFQTEFKLENISIGLAYDANISKLGRITNGFGAFEIGLKFRFNQPVDYDKTVNLRMLDSDNDGIADESDHCPFIAGNAANKGCPGRADSDGDGIVDEVDLCPGIAGSPIHGGCPDSDGDGVADIDDECPTIYGALHFQGCPDSDQDGISDKYDACPVTFGLISNKGCPDNKYVQPTTNLGEYIVKNVENNEQKVTEVLPIQKPETLHKHSYNVNSYTNERANDSEHSYQPAQVKNQQPNHTTTPLTEVSQAKKLANDGEVIDNMMVFFDKDESTLDFLDKKRLRDFVIALGSDPNLKIVLKGHTDEDGGDLYNMELGYRRAEAVKRYLAQFGLADDRVMTLSYGEEMPLSILEGEVSNAKNRRVELILVK